MTLINDLLDFSKIEAGKLEIENTTFDLGTLVANHSSLFRETAAKKDLNLIVEIADGVNGNYLGDPVRIGQILLNLVSNAIKFTQQGFVKISVSKKKSHLKFAVEDSGIGIDKNIIAHLFQPFTQGDGSTAREYGGTGLGLSISKHLAELMGGEIGVQSTAGSGSTFWFTVKAEQVEATKVQYSKELKIKSFERDRSSAEREHQILVAEDNPANQLLIETLLTKLGFKARIVSNGRDAVEALKNQTFDLVLMDCQMPELDGYEATKEIRRNEKSGQPRVTIVALTANALKEDEERCLKAGMDAYLSKPIKKSKLVEVLSAYFPHSKVG